MNEAEKTSSPEAVSIDLTANQIIASVIVPALPIENREVVECATSSRLQANENCLAAIAPHQKLAIITLIQALSSNSNLSERVTQLEQALTECLQTLQIHKKRSRIAHTMLAQKNDQLAAAQEQIQHQQTLIATLTAQLQSSQERAAHLEWEHYLTQASYKEQSQQLIQTENTCRELRTRLTRQQHYTLQLKVALEKCLESKSSYSESAADDVDSIPTDLKSQERFIQVQSFFSKAESIPPWSAQPHFNSELEPDWAESVLLEDVQTSDYQPPSDCLYCGDDTTLLETATLKPCSPQTSQDVIDASLVPSKLISTTAPEQPLNQDVPAEVQLQDLLNVLEIEVTADSLELPTSVTPDPAISASVQLDQSLNSNLAEDLVDSSELTSSPITQSPSQSSQQPINTSNSNWPSPLVYPPHPHKPKKSLAAIELPTFTQSRG